MNRKISVIGLGYVGLPVAVAFGKKSKVILEFLAFKLGVINADLVREHKRYYDKNEYDILSKKTDSIIKKFYFFQLGLNTVCILR